MLPSSSSHLARCGQINHYKKFWLLQTQLEKQEQTSSTALSLGVPAGSATVKESKPLVSSNTTLVVGGDHLINNNSNTAGHGSCRGDHMVSSTPSSSRGAGAFPYCSINEPSTLKLYNGRVGYTHKNNGSLRDSRPALSLAVDVCESGAQPINFLHQTWTPLSYNRAAASELHLQSNSPNDEVPSHTPRIRLVNGSSPGAEECESSECSNSRGDQIKRGGVVWDNISNTPASTSSFSTLPVKQRQRELAGARGHDSRSMNIPSFFQESTALPFSSRSDHVCGISSGPLRTCTLCGTAKTPLWRSGPEGPKSLCNACGIRVKKTKRLQAAMEAAGEGAEAIISSASSPAGAYKRLLAAAAAATTCKGVGTAHKRKLSMEAAENQSEPMLQLKKKKKKAAGSRRTGCCSWPPPNVAGLDSGTCYRISGEASANLAADGTTSKKFSNLFARDVEEAAALLMALSCGLVPS